jgi:hypothetical protein
MLEMIKNNASRFRLCRKKPAATAKKPKAVNARECYTGGPVAPMKLGKIIKARKKHEDAEDLKRLL